MVVVSIFVWDRLKVLGSVVVVVSVFVWALTGGARARLKEFGSTDFWALLSGIVEVAGATTSVSCSHAPRSAALARMQINFFIVVDWRPMLGQSLNRSNATFRPSILQIPSLRRI